MLLNFYLTGGSFDSMEDEGGAYLDRPGNSNKMDAQSDSSSFSTDPLSDDASYKTPQVRSSHSVLFYNYS